MGGGNTEGYNYQELWADYQKGLADAGVTLNVSQSDMRANLIGSGVNPNSDIIVQLETQFESEYREGIANVEASTAAELLMSQYGTERRRGPGKGFHYHEFTREEALAADTNGVTVQLEQLLGRTAAPWEIMAAVKNGIDILADALPERLEVEERETDPLAVAASTGANNTPTPWM